MLIIIILIILIFLSSRSEHSGAGESFYLPPPLFKNLLDGKKTIDIKTNAKQQFFDSIQISKSGDKNSYPVVEYRTKGGSTVNVYITSTPVHFAKWADILPKGKEMDVIKKINPDVKSKEQFIELMDEFFNPTERNGAYMITLEVVKGSFVEGSTKLEDAVKEYNAHEKTVIKKKK